MSGGRIVTAIVGVLLLGLGLGTLPGAVENRALADELGRRGTVVTATSVETFVTRQNGKGGDYLEVEDVRVRLPGAGASGADGWVVLVGHDNAELDDVPGWTDRWTPASPASGYAPPLRVSVVQDDDRRPRAMAVQDVPAWAGPGEAVVSSVVAAVGALLLGLLALVVRRGRRRPAYLGG